MTEDSEKAQGNLSALGGVEDPELERAFRNRAAEILGSKRRHMATDISEALKLWLAWRGDPSYLIAAVGKRRERETAWHVVRYRQIPELAAKHDEVEARSLGEVFPDHVLAFLVKFVCAELDRHPDAEVLSENPNSSTEDRSERISADRIFSHAKRGATVVVRWPSSSAYGLSRKTIMLAKDRIRYSEYPALDRIESRNPIGLTRFLEMSEKKNRTRWVASHG